MAMHSTSKGVFMATFLINYSLIMKNQSYNIKMTSIWYCTDFRQAWLQNIPAKKNTSITKKIHPYRSFHIDQTNQNQIKSQTTWNLLSKIHHFICSMRVQTHHISHSHIVWQHDMLTAVHLDSWRADDSLIPAVAARWLQEREGK